MILSRLGIVTKLHGYLASTVASWVIRRSKPLNINFLERLRSIHE